MGFFSNLTDVTLTDKDASHVEPHSKGGSGHPDNIKWEDRSTNRARGDREMTLAAISPALLVIGGAGMVKEFFNILDNHKEKTKAYYESLTQQELDYLGKIEDELIYEHNKNLEFFDNERTKNLAFLAESKALNHKISNRPIESGVEAALKRYLESAEIARSLGSVPVTEKLLNGCENSLTSSED